MKLFYNHCFTFSVLNHQSLVSVYIISSFGGWHCKLEKNDEWRREIRVGNTGSHMLY